MAGVHIPQRRGVLVILVGRGLRPHLEGRRVGPQPSAGRCRLLAAPRIALLGPQRGCAPGQSAAGITEAMRTLVREYREAGKDLQEPAVQNALNLDFAQRANGAGESALEAVGVTMPQFEASVKAHSQNETVARAMAMLQMRQQQELQGMASMPV